MIADLPLSPAGTVPAVSELVAGMARRSREAGLRMARTTAAERTRALLQMADAIASQESQILTANSLDLAEATAAGLKGPMRERLELSSDRLRSLAEALREVAGQPDPLGGLEDEHVRPNGLRVARMRIPLGAVAMIYESRPNVTADAAGLCVKSGNAVLLRGGSEALRTNTAIAEALREGLAGSGLPTDAVQLIPISDRAAVDELLKQSDFIDLVIPRGGEGLIRAVVEKSRIPVLQHYKGVCHVYLDETAPVDRSVRIVTNAKVQRPGVCNAMETLLVHRGAVARVLPPVAESLRSQGVEIRGCPATRATLGDWVVPAAPQDWDAEYLDLVVSVRVVSDLDEALDHIADHASSHTEAIVTDDGAAADRFVQGVQSSTVLVNASTRFADGGELGLGAEIGISTSKLHAYGPMGAKELTTRKFVVFGDGQVRG